MGWREGPGDIHKKGKLRNPESGRGDGYLVMFIAVAAGEGCGIPFVVFLPLVLLVVFGSQTFRSVHVVWYTSPLLTLPTYTRILPLTSLTLDTEVLSILLSLEPRSRSLSSLHSPTLYYPSLAFPCQTYTSTNKKIAISTAR
jgi:hypothetical protein